MLDLGHLYNTSNRSIQYFSTPRCWVTWNKPRYCSFIRILCIGAGGFGGRGGTITYNNLGSYYASGGGGGGSGAMTYVIMPANLLPDILYVNTGTSGFGESYVSVAPNNSGIYTVCYASGGSTGEPGVGISGNAPGGGGGFASFASSMILGSVYAFTYAGSNGGAGTPGTGGSSINYPTTGLLLSGGGGGGGYSGASSSGGTTYGGGYIFAPASQTSVYNIFQTITNGSNGIELYKPLLSTGGSGGGSGGSSEGGAGGFGSGGGGSSHSTSTQARGGNGLVIIQTW